MSFVDTVLQTIVKHLDVEAIMQSPQVQELQVHVKQIAADFALIKMQNENILRNQLTTQLQLSALSRKLGNIAGGINTGDYDEAENPPHGELFPSETRNG